MSWMTFLPIERSGHSADVNISDDPPIAVGGYGSIHQVLLIRSPKLDIEQAGHHWLAKRIDHVDRICVPTLNAYLAHVHCARKRLQAIRTEESSAQRPRLDILHHLDRFVLSLPTHYRTQDTVMWFLRPKAPGQVLSSLRDLDQAARVRIARGILNAMITLRRANLVHLDCVHDNVVVGPEEQVTLIDLDGCGVQSRNRRNVEVDEWDHRPTTLGHLNLVRLPYWYPRDLEVGTPRAGRYLFAERWVVLDSLIRLLSGGHVNALSWLTPELSRQYLRAGGNPDSLQLLGDEWPAITPVEDLCGFDTILHGAALEPKRLTTSMGHRSFYSYLMHLLRRRYLS